jgi:hypothetical protein
MSMGGGADGQTNEQQFDAGDMRLHFPWEVPPHHCYHHHHRRVVVAAKVVVDGGLLVAVNHKENER